MSVEENMALARRFMEARVKGNLDAVDEMMAPDYVNHTSLLSVQEPDREGVKWATAQLSAAVSDASVDFEDQVAAGDKVVTRLVAHATHDRGELMGVAPTGRELTWMAIFIHRISEGKIAEEWGGSMGLSELLRRQRLEQEIRERERVEQELRVARSIQQASLPKEVPTLEGWQISPLYRPTRQGGGGRLLRLPPPLGWPAGAGRGGRNRQGCACSAGYVHHLRYAAGSLTSHRLFLAGANT
jgi:predicted ester cyclase